jgi:hypothetical protein
MTEAVPTWKRFPSREPFDPARVFAARKVFRMQGRDYTFDDPIDKDVINMRRLRQLYDQRMIYMLPVDMTPAKSTHPKFSELPDDALRAWLRSHNITPRANWTRAKLELRAEEAWLAQSPVSEAPVVDAPPPPPRTQRVRTVVAAG